MQTPTTGVMVNVLETDQGTEVHLITDLDMLANILNNCDRWTQMNDTFLCIRGDMVGVFAWVGDLAQAEAAS